MNDRIDRIEDTTIGEQLKPIREKLMIVNDEVVQFYDKQNARGSNNEQNTANGSNKITNQNNTKHD